MAAPPAPVEPDELLGTWRLERRIVDRPVPDGTGRHPQQFGRVVGTLTLAAGPGPDSTVTWFEEGTMTWAGQALPVTRHLLIRRADRSTVADRDVDTAWVVCFADGRPFHPWRPGAPVVHPCVDDTYCGLVAVDAARRRLRILWDVSGPAKDRRLFSRCTRL